MKKTSDLQRWFEWVRNPKQKWKSYNKFTTSQHDTVEQLLPPGTKTSSVFLRILVDLKAFLQEWKEEKWYGSQDYSYTGKYAVPLLISTVDQSAPALLGFLAAGLCTRKP